MLVTHLNYISFLTKQTMHLQQGQGDIVFEVIITRKALHRSFHFIFCYHFRV